MNTPICDFVEKYAKEGTARLHMPGHKGRGFIGVEHLDITEIEGADLLYDAHGIIKQSEDNAASLFGSARTLYSAEGSTLAIRAMLYLALLDAKRKGRSQSVIAGRNAHKALMTAAALLDFNIDWIFSEDSESLVLCKITPEMLEARLAFLEQMPAAVYVTSPDYLGNMTDIEGLSRVCREKGTLLLVDNAHGAYLNFLGHSMHPMAKGAHMCADSAHKTLPVLTGGAYLHISKDTDNSITELADFAMSLFASTSPSYLILQSLDRANKYIADSYPRRLMKSIAHINQVKTRLCEGGYSLQGDEPLKITVKAKEYGYTGHQIAEYLAKNNLMCEFSDPDFTVMMVTPETDPQELELLGTLLLSLEKREAIDGGAPQCPVAERVMSIRDAVMSPSVELPVCKAVGKVLASARIGCPPAVPIAICGERISKEHLALFEYYGIEKCRIVT